MKKFLVIGTFVLAATLGLASFAYAQTPAPTTPQTPWGSGKMGPGGMHGQYDSDQLNPMHDYMEAAFAQALGVTEEELQSAREAGKTVWQLAEEKGLTVEEFQAKMLEARQSAIQAMVADGIMTQEQADWMLSRMQGNWGEGGYSGSGCPGMSGGFGGRRGGSGGQWGSPETPSTSNPTVNSL